MNKTVQRTDLFAEAVLEMITKWGMIATCPDKEDSSGRAKVRLLTPEELVERAMETTKLALSRLIDTGHVEDVNPASEEYKSFMRAKRGY